jgi:hypothetical protein
MVLIGMYDDVMKLKLYSRHYSINKLIEFDPKYKEDLTSLYMGTNQFEKHWHLIQELNETIGKTDRRELKARSHKENIKSEITNLEEQIVNIRSKN